MNVDGNARKSTLSTILRTLAEDADRQRISVSDLLDALGDRALAALLFVFAFPNVLPVPPGTSAVLGAPLVVLAAQLAFGLRPWLPAVIARRSMSRTDFGALVRRIGPWLARAERLLRPRAVALVVPPMEYAVGAVCLLLGLILALPIPLGNVLPALAIGVMALGVLERDGLWVSCGLLIGAAAAAVVWGVIFALTKAVLFFFAQVLP